MDRIKSPIEVELDKVKEANGQDGRGHDVFWCETDFPRFCALNGNLARKAIEADRRIDLQENEIDQKVVTLVARGRPVARDLRFLTATVKTCAFYERMADQGVNLAERTLELLRVRRGQAPGRQSATYLI